MPTMCSHGEAAMREFDKLMELGVEVAPLSDNIIKDAKKYATLKNAYKDKQIR